MKYCVEIHAGAGLVERHVLPSGTTVIGSGGSADIRPRGAERLAREHLRVSATEAGCRVTLVEGLEGCIAHQGAATRNATVPWNDEIFVEGIRISFLREAEARKGASPVLLALLLFALTMIAGALARSRMNAVESRTVAAPELFSKPAPCKERTSEAAEHLAVRSERGALAKQERYAFVFTEGYEAAHLLAEARECFLVAGRADDATRTGAALETWKARVNADYAALRVNLRLSLEQERWGSALDAIRALESLVAHLPNEPYRVLLERERRGIQQRMQNKH